MRFLYLISLFLLMLIISCDQWSNEERNLPQVPASPIKISWEVNSNIQEEGVFHATLYLKNSADDPFERSDWTLYFNSIRLIEAESLPEYLRLTHINGDFFKLEPTAMFPAIAPGDILEIPYIGQHFSIKKTDSPQGFYFVFDDGRIEAVDQIEVLPFLREEQTMRNPDDRLEVPTPSSEFRKNEDLSLLDRSALGKITPTPVRMTDRSGTFELSGVIPIYHDPLFSREARQLSEYLNFSLGIGNQTHLIPLDSDTTEPYIHIERSATPLEGDEAYRLEIAPNQITITASHSSGIYYGVQSLKALFDNRENDNFVIPGLYIEDYPAFEYRGMHLDVARNFQSVEDVKLLLDAMALYKLNRFHFHLTDDEGWRIAIDPLPELVEIGGVRGHTTDEANRLNPSYGSGPDPTPGRSFGSGWYTRNQYMELLRYADERHIEVIPEIDVPGHARAAIIAMRARAERLKNAGQLDEAEFYRLDEEGDLSEYLSIQNFDDNVINVCIESTYNFMELVFDELIDMHRVADVPLNTIHVGGDEVPQGVWERSPACKSLMESEGIENVRDLQSYFFNRLNRMLLDRGLKMAGWEEVVFSEDPEDGSLNPNPEFMENVIPHVWSNIWGSGTEHYTYELANLGYQVIMSHASTFYFDMSHSKDWEEPGFYWAAMFDLKEPYSFIPFDLYKNAVVDNYGRPISPEVYEEATVLLPHGRENILGIQGQLWAETVNRKGRMHYLIFPKLLGLAERAWVGNAEWSKIDERSELFEARDIAWREFANRMGQLELPRFDRNYDKIEYRIPTPGAIIQSGTLYANVSFPGMEIRYTTDGSDPDIDSNLYTDPEDVSEADEVNLAVFSTTGRSGRVVKLSVNQPSD